MGRWIMIASKRERPWGNVKQWKAGRLMVVRTQPKLDLWLTKDPCCTHGTSILTDCYSVECMKLDMEEAVHKAEDADAREKEETEKELAKNFEIGKVCIGLGIPTNKDEIK